MKPSILIVDDQVMMTHFLTYYFTKNYEVNVKYDGIEALLWLENGNTPQVIVADLDMPLMNGFEFIKALKSKDYLKNIPVIILSGKVSQEEKEKCIQLGAEDYLVKPFNPEELEALIRRVLITNRKA